jgi:hypothetical protein
MWQVVWDDELIYLFTSHAYKFIFCSFYDETLSSELTGLLEERKCTDLSYIFRMNIVVSALHRIIFLYIMLV